MNFWHQPQQAAAEAAAAAGFKRPRITQLRFSEAAPIQHDDPKSPLSPEEVQNIWYQREELAFFKLAARKYLFGIDREEEESRGFEHYDDLERAREKALAIKCVLLAQDKGMKQDNLATIAQRCSESAVEGAFVAGCQDYCEVYQPHMASFLSSTMGNSCKRQSQTDETSSSKIKRIRMS